MFKNPHALNVLFAIGYASLAGVGGSVITVLLTISIIGGFLLFLMRRTSISNLLPTDWLIIGPTIIYFAVMAGSLIHPEFEWIDLKAIIQPLLIGLFIFAVMRYRTVKGTDYFEVFLKYAPYCGILVIPWIFYQLLFEDVRMTGGAGNAIPFAMICAIFIPLSLLSMRGSKGMQRIISVVGAIALIVALLLSQTRSMYLALFINFSIIFIYFLIHSRHRRNVAIVGILLTVLAGGIVSTSSTLVERGRTIFDVGHSFITQSRVTDGAVRQRIALYQRGWCLLQERPLQGYGIAKRKELLKQGRGEALAAGGVVCASRHREFTHFHNGLLTSGIDAGLPGILSAFILLISPLGFAFFSPGDSNKSKRMVFAFVVVTTYSIAGMSNLLFGHDLIDALFLICCLFLVLSVVKTNDPAMQDATDAPKDIIPLFKKC